MITTEQFDKLPKWAQQEVKDLTRSVEAGNRRIDELVNAMAVERSVKKFGFEDDACLVDPYDLRLKFPMDTAVDFGIGKGHFSVRWDETGGVLRVSSSTSTIAVLPQSGNSVHLKLFGL